MLLDPDVNTSSTTDAAADTEEALAAPKPVPVVRHRAVASHRHAKAAGPRVVLSTEPAPAAGDHAGPRPEPGTPPTVNRLASGGDNETADLLQLRYKIVQLEKQLVQLQGQAQVLAASSPPASAGKAADQQAGLVTPPSAPAVEKLAPAVPIVKPVPVLPGPQAAAPLPTVTTAPAAIAGQESVSPRIWVALGVVLLAAVPGAVWWLRRQKVERAGQSSGLAGIDDELLSPTVMVQPREQNDYIIKDVRPGENLADLGIVVEDHERWAIEEAQIYLAQGWRERAIDLLQTEIYRNPYQVEIWLRLFELYHKEGMREPFAALFDRCLPIGGALPFWHSIKAMGKDIDPADPRYAA